MANILILTQEQAVLVRTMHRVNEIMLVPSLLHILHRIPSDLLKQPEMTLYQKRAFVLFVTHAFRLMIIVQSVDKNALDAERNPNLKPTLK
jgi:hypothetical protein